MSWGQMGQHNFDCLLSALADEVRLTSSLSTIGVALSAIQKMLRGFVRYQAGCVVTPDGCAVHVNIVVSP